MNNVMIPVGIILISCFLLGTGFFLGRIWEKVSK